MSNNVNINGATDRTSIKCHKIYKDNRESLNKRVRVIFDEKCLRCKMLQQHAANTDCCMQHDFLSANTLYQSWIDIAFLNRYDIEIHF